MKILIEKASEWDFCKEAEFNHIEDCINYLLTSSINSKKTTNFVVTKLLDNHFPYLTYDGENEKVYNAGELDFIVKIYDDYIE